eukprot:COSAG01_NODE_18573_length_1067_cov_0.775826_1_plen_28_part_10
MRSPVLCALSSSLVHGRGLLVSNSCYAL